MESYMPDRCLRQLGYIQIVPMHAFRGTKVVRPWNSSRYRLEHPVVVADDCWSFFPAASTFMLMIYTLAQIPSACDETYMEWYTRYSHPHIMPDMDAHPQTVLTRSNSEMWVNRWTTMGTGMLAALRRVDEDTAEMWAEEVDKLMHDWHLAK
ncbi:uncharacterized protein [Euphorbia lathyris]|uniref:uncharacterized protein n=1 Tax=Euphorbia lathyris TaxID=212925 RepID=UPI0033139CEC